MVQYVARYQYTNMEHVIQTYSAVEVRSVIRFYTVWNYSGMKTRKVVCSEWQTHALWCIHCTEVFVYFCHTTVLYGVKSYYASNFYSTVHLNRVLYICVLVSCNRLYHLTWNFYSVSSNSKLSSSVNLVSLYSFVVVYEFRETCFWDDPHISRYFYYKW